MLFFRPAAAALFAETDFADIQDKIIFDGFAKLLIRRIGIRSMRMALFFIHTMTCFLEKLM